MSKCPTKSDPSCKDYAENIKNKANKNTPFQIDKPNKQYWLLIYKFFLINKKLLGYIFLEVFLLINYSYNYLLTS